jgi:two-component system, repressor protein LuxO
MSTARILIIEDTARMDALHIKHLRRYTPDVAENGAKGLMLINQNVYDTVILNLYLPDMNGLKILKHLQTDHSDIPVIVVTAHGSMNTAVDTMRLGAFDFIMQPFPSGRLNAAVAAALEHRRTRMELLHFQTERHRDVYKHIIGTSHAMQIMFKQIDRVTSNKANVFIHGENGTEKELLAETIHRASVRSNEHFIALNCSLISPDVLESELFGHIKGAGNDEHRRGAIALADGGTLFLDEISDLSADLQAKLLRFMHTGRYTPVGSRATEKADVRIISAAKHDPMVDVERGTLREDLYYRLHIAPIELPPLRERDDDVLKIADHLLKRFAVEEQKEFESFDEDTLKVLRFHDWTGNIRQLENLIHQLVIMNDGTVITVDMLPRTYRRSSNIIPIPKSAESYRNKPIWPIEQEYMV